MTKETQNSMPNHPAILTPKPLVSVCCITYNHENFIRDAIEGFLKQTTTFPFEIIIHDDASTDNTTQIIRSYQAKFPSLFKLIIQTENQFSKGVSKVLKNVYGAASGKYIALCEGDDYWTDPLKLQKQVDFLESHKECTSCFHDVLYQYDDGELKPSPYNHTSIKETYTIDDLLVKNVWTKTCSCVFHNGLIDYELDSFSHLKIGDWPLFVLLASKGNIGYIHEVMGVYRVHANSTFSTIGYQAHYNAIIESRQSINEFFNQKYQEEIMPEIFRFTFDLAKLYFSHNDPKNGRKTLIKCLKMLKYHGKIRLSEIARLSLKAVGLI